MSKNLKILFIPKWYPSRVHELNGNFIRRHAQAVAMKHSVAVLYVCGDPNMKDETYDTEFEIDHGIPTIKIFYNNSLPDLFLVSSFIKLFRYLRACRKGIKSINEKFGKPDICHIHVLARTFFIGYYYKMLYNIPFLVSEQWTGYFQEDGRYKGFFKKMLTKTAVKRAVAVTAVSESLKDAMLSHGLMNQYFIVPNVVDTQLFYPSAEREKAGKFILLHISNLNEKQKNISGMINAVKKLSEKRTDFEFHIVGDGVERNNLEKLSRKCSLLNTIVFFHGWKTPQEVAERMRNADYFLLFSNYDSMPCVMAESLASGVPVIGSAIHGIKEHVNEERGILVPPGDEGALYGALLKALNSAGSFDKERIHEYAEQNFSYGSVAEKFDTIYQRIFDKAM